MQDGTGDAGEFRAGQQDRAGHGARRALINGAQRHARAKGMGQDVDGAVRVGTADLGQQRGKAVPGFRGAAVCGPDRPAGVPAEADAKPGTRLTAQTKMPGPADDPGIAAAGPVRLQRRVRTMSRMPGQVFVAMHHDGHGAGVGLDATPDRGTPMAVGAIGKVQPVRGSGDP